MIINCGTDVPFVCRITFTPTIQHCSMATVIGLCLRVKLKHYFPPHYKVSFSTFTIFTVKRQARTVIDY